MFGAWLCQENNELNGKKIISFFAINYNHHS